MADIPLTMPTPASPPREDHSGLHRYQAIMRVRRRRKRSQRSKVEAHQKMKALQAIDRREQSNGEPLSTLAASYKKKFRTLQDERHKLIQHLSKLRQENRDLNALAANPEAASELERTQQDLIKQVAGLHVRLDRLQYESEGRKDHKNAELKSKVRDMELAVKLAARRVDEMKEILRDI